MKKNLHIKTHYILILYHIDWRFVKEHFNEHEEEKDYKNRNQQMF